MKKSKLFIIINLITLLFSISVSAHEERPATFPAGDVPVPKLRTSGGNLLVVCTPQSQNLIKTNLKGSMQKDNLALLAKCQYSSIQDAINAAQSGDRIQILPGIYKELAYSNNPFPSFCKDYSLAVRAALANNQPPPTPSTEVAQYCVLSNYSFVPTAALFDYVNYVPNYEFQRQYPHAQNIIAVLGDTNGDHQCDTKCNLQITGSARPEDVLIQGNQAKLNVIRLDRANGIYLGNFTIEHSDFNNIYVLETNGFHFNNIISRYSNEYGFLSFASDNGLYENIETYGNGDSGVYPGSGPQSDVPGVCKYGIEIRNVDAHHNMAGYAGTAGDNIWTHHNKFHHNAIGIATESFSPGHPGMPQNCAKIEHNEIYSNNLNPYIPHAQDNNPYVIIDPEACKTPYSTRDAKVLCPAYLGAVGSGIIIAGGNQNLVSKNFIYDNWRFGASLSWIPAFVRGETDPNLTFDTSHYNTFSDNHMGVKPDGTRAPNGLDFRWDGEGINNVWTDNKGSYGTESSIISIPASLPSIQTNVFNPPTDLAALFMAQLCSTWDPLTWDYNNPTPSGCLFYLTPPQPQ